LLNGPFICSAPKTGQLKIPGPEKRDIKTVFITKIFIIKHNKKNEMLREEKNLFLKLLISQSVISIM
jgi:hypothetical protein